ncbi:MAG: diacylglycerol kinase [Candidatus Omnitrophica bacterium]|nr:diacylglycerol kinase [Candidatus Omnitrophota bacterium]
MRESKIVESFNAAIEGFLYVVKTERNMRIHFLSAIFILLLGIYLNFMPQELMILAIAITLVLVAEMINTAVELIVDIVVETEFHPIARVVKDASAGAVLLTVVNAIIVGYMLFAGKVPFTLEEGIARLGRSPWHLTFISIIVVLALTILGKVTLRSGTPLRGGMPSGHAAIAFAMWTVIAFLTRNAIVMLLAFVMAFLIARHRIKDSVHTVWEVVAGAILGILSTGLVFQLLRR